MSSLQALSQNFSGNNIKAENMPLIIADRYKVLSSLGVGGMGNVYLAEDTMLGEEQVALKILKPEFCQNESHKKRFLREVQLTRRVTSPHVVRTFEAGQDGDKLYFTMEYIKGQTLKDRYGRNRVSTNESAEVVLDIARGLASIHEQEIIHRDLKLSNVMITDENVIKIADFGVAKPGVSDLTAQDELIGSATHMAPEVWQSGDVSALTDIYSLGVIAYELVTGMLPFDGLTPNELMWKHMKAPPTPPMDLYEDIPKWFSDLIVSMLSKRPEERPRSAGDLALTIQRNLSGLPEPEANSFEDAYHQEDKVESYFKHNDTGLSLEEDKPLVNSEEGKAVFEENKRQDMSSRHNNERVILGSIISVTLCATIIGVTMLLGYIPNSIGKSIFQTLLNPLYTALPFIVLALVLRSISSAAKIGSKLYLAGIFIQFIIICTATGSSYKFLTRTKASPLVMVEDILSITSTLGAKVALLVATVEDIHPVISAKGANLTYGGFGISIWTVGILLTVLILGSVILSTVGSTLTPYLRNNQSTVNSWIIGAFSAGVLGTWSMANFMIPDKSPLHQAVIGAAFKLPFETLSILQCSSCIMAWTVILSATIYCTRKD